MSEQNTNIEKNYPGAGDGSEINSAGSLVSGGVGSATGLNAAGSSVGSQLGNTATAGFGSTTGDNAVNPTGNAGGILRPEQAQRFIDYVWDATVLAKDGRRVTMRANTMEIEKVNVGERVIRAASQGSPNYTNTGARFTKVELTTKKIRLDWEVATEALEDNIEGGALEDRLGQGRESRSAQTRGRMGRRQGPRGR